MSAYSSPASAPAARASGTCTAPAGFSVRSWSGTAASGHTAGRRRAAQPALQRPRRRGPVAGEARRRRLAGLDRARQAVGQAAPRAAPADPYLLHHLASTVSLDQLADGPSALVLAYLADDQHRRRAVV